MTFGFDTAVQIATDAIDRLHTTAESHDRVMVVEVMGRHAGHIATWAGIAGGRHHDRSIPEEPFDIDDVCAMLITAVTSKGKFASIVVVAEGAEPAEGTDALVSERGRPVRPRPPRRHRRPARPRDRGTHRVRDARDDARPRPAGRHARRRSTGCSATRFGIAAIDAVHDGRVRQMVACAAAPIVQVSLAEAVGELKLVDPDLYHRVAAIFFAG